MLNTSIQRRTQNLKWEGVWGVASEKFLVTMTFRRSEIEGDALHENTIEVRRIFLKQVLFCLWPAMFQFT